MLIVSEAVLPIQAAPIQAPSQLPARMPKTGDGSSMGRDDWALEIRPGVQVDEETLVLPAAAPPNSGGLVQPAPAREVLSEGQIAMPRRLPNAGSAAPSGQAGALAALALVLLLGAWRLRRSVS
jgi:hypothetical protein